jgi:hypothetical protein
MHPSDGPDIAYCSHRVPRVGGGGVWPAQARQRALRAYDALHPPRFCREPTVAIMTVAESDWLGTLCATHYPRFAHLDGHVHTAPKQPARILVIRLIPGQPDGTRLARQPRSWQPR